jgi:hypothetical protein
MNEQPACVSVGSSQFDDCRARDIWLELYADFARRRKVRASLLEWNNFGMTVDLPTRSFALWSFMLKRPSIPKPLSAENRYTSNNNKE